MELLAVGAGGGLGAICRYLLGLLPIRMGNGFPLVTLGINVLGGFAIGVIAALSTRNPALSPRAVLFFKTGICGGFTTFSTFSLETAALLTGEKPMLGVTYALLSVVLSVAACFGGQLLVQ